MEDDAKMDTTQTETPGTTVATRMLISNTSAGSIIGKGGATISEFQDRIVLLSGTVKSILTALHLVLTKINSEDGSSGHSSVRLVVPNMVCGAIIGKGGATIRTFSEDSGASIKLSSQDQNMPGVTDRVVTITGTVDQQLRAVALIVTKISEDPNYSVYASLPLAYPQAAAFQAAGMGSSGLHLPSMGAPAMPNPMSQFGQLGQKQPVVLTTTAPSTSLTVAVPDEHVGAVVGRMGKTITEIQALSGARVKISDRDDYVEGTRNRKVTVTGSQEAVQIAQYLITQKVTQSAADYSGPR
eukprot:jgi/Mesvir1/9581/Mv25619-RA.1